MKVTQESYDYMFDYIYTQYADGTEHIDFCHTSRLDRNHNVSVHYIASQAGRYVEKRYEAIWNVHINDVQEVEMPVTLVIPAGSVQVGEGYITGYLDYPQEWQGVKVDYIYTSSKMTEYVWNVVISGLTAQAVVKNGVECVKEVLVFDEP